MIRPSVSFVARGRRALALSFGFALTLSFGATAHARAGDPPTEADYWRIEPVPVPDDIVLEVSGLAVEPDGDVLACTRRGELYRIEGVASKEPSFDLLWSGLHEPLGLLLQGDDLYLVQRGELSCLRDEDGDGRFERLDTICDDWRISGNYHEYNFGPRLDPDGNFWITTNKPFGDEPFGRAHWRGYALRVTPEGEMLPTCAGLRSPAGLQSSPDGEMFYTDNQGEWCGASKLSLLTPGDFHGHPWGAFSTKEPQWPYEPVVDVPNGTLMPEVPALLPSFKLPAVWFPYDKMGRSPAGFVWDEDGKLGPFAGQIFVGDQYQASVLRVALEKVGGHWQGACFPFRRGFGCGIIRLAWHENALLTGQTARGWGSLGPKQEGLERLVWTGAVPFEIERLSLEPDGFTLYFTREFDAASALRSGGFALSSYTYRLHDTYGSPELDQATLAVHSIECAPDRRSLRLRADGLRAGYVHELHADGLRAATGEPLLHPRAYYTAIRLRPEPTED